MPTGLNSLHRVNIATLSIQVCVCVHLCQTAYLVRDGSAMHTFHVAVLGVDCSPWRLGWFLSVEVLSVPHCLPT